MNRCLPCELKRQRLQHKLNATKERAIRWAEDNHLDEVVVFIRPDVEDEEPGDDEGAAGSYGFGSDVPAGGRLVEYLRVLR